MATRSIRSAGRRPPHAGRVCSPESCDGSLDCVVELKSGVLFFIENGKLLWEGNGGYVAGNCFRLNGSRIGNGDDLILRVRFN